MDDKHRSLISNSKDMIDLNPIKKPCHGVCPAEEYKGSLLNFCVLENKGAEEDITQIEEKLKEIIVYERHIRALRQGYENKLRLYKLSEAITTSKRP